MQHNKQMTIKITCDKKCHGEQKIDTN